MSNLYREETWTLKKEKDVPGITNLPLRFKTIMNKLLSDILTIPTAKTDWLTAIVVAPFLEIVRALGDSYHILAFDIVKLDTGTIRNTEVLIIVIFYFM